MSINDHYFGDDGPCNSDRADWAGRALSIFCEDTGLDQEIEKNNAVSDLICNLGHYCDRHNLDFLALVPRAIGVWDVEKREEANGAANALYPERKVFIAIVDPN